LANGSKSALSTLCHHPRKNGPPAPCRRLSWFSQQFPAGSMNLLRHESIRCGRCISSGNALPMGVSAVCRLMMDKSRAAKLPCSAASALCPFQSFQKNFRVARVSRLIGKSDTTAKPVGLQVGLCPYPFYSIRIAGAQAPLTLETPLQSEWRFAVLRWSLASRAFEGGGYIHRAFCRFSRPVSPFEGPLQWRSLLPGPAVLLAGWESFPAAGTSLAPSLLQSRDRSSLYLVSMIYER